jgi:hypothetical protein
VLLLKSQKSPIKSGKTISNDEAKKKILKKNQANLDEPPNPELISQTCNSLSSRPVLIQEGQYPINLILKDKITK